jgi:predicted transcriptional regulator
MMKKLATPKPHTAHSRMLNQIRIRFGASGGSLLALSKKSGVPYTTCYRMMHQGRDVPTRTAEKILDALP